MTRAIQRIVVLLAAVLLLMLAAAACSPTPAPAQAAAAPSPTPLPLPGPLTSSGSSSAGSSPTEAAAPSAEVTGAALYQLSCAACHGADRGGNTFEQDGQKVDVPALAWSDLSSAYATDPSRGSVADQLGLAITKGQDETGGDLAPMMPRWSSLSQTQLSSLVDFIQAGGTATGALTPPASDLTGEQLYQAACASCHGKDRAGNTFELDGQKVDVPALAWDDLNSAYATDPSRGTVADQIALAITKGQDETGGDLAPMMPRWSFLSQAQVSSLIDYIQGGTTAGGPELSGASLYQLSCAACHGKDRAGNTFEMDGQKLDVPALAWEDLNSAYATDPSRGTVADQIALAITKGQDETGGDLAPMMPRWSSLSQSQVSSLIDFIQAGGTAPDTLAPPATDLKGEELYGAACAACHGADGAGKTFEMDGSKITTPSLSWNDLSQTYSSDPSRGTVEAQVALAIAKGQAEDGTDLEAMMPRWSFLSQAQVDSLVQYIETTFK